MCVRTWITQPASLPVASCDSWHFIGSASTTEMPQSWPRGLAKRYFLPLFLATPLTSLPGKILADHQATHVQDELLLFLWVSYTVHILCASQQKCFQLQLGQAIKLEACRCIPCLAIHSSVQQFWGCMSCGCHSRLHCLRSL